MENHVKEFHERQLNKQYVVVCMDATMLNIRRDSVSKEAVHILVGIGLGTLNWTVFKRPYRTEVLLEQYF